jgi:hypothetical protein
MLVFSLVVARAAEIRVPQDAPTLAEAVASSEAGDVVTIDGGQLPSLGSAEALVIVHPLTLRGVGAVRPSLGGGDPADALFLVQGAGALTLEDLILDGGEVNRAVHVQAGDLTLRRVTTVGHLTTGDGGAVLLDANTGAVTIEDSQLTYGTTGRDGGLIAALGGSLTLRRARLASGVATNDGGLVHVTGASLVVEDSVFELGAAGGRGGALHLRSAVGATLERTKLLGNVANSDRGGGAIYAEATPLDVADGWFENNTTHGTEGGGAIYLRDRDHTLLRVVFCGNSALDGGAVRLHGGSVTLTNAVLIGNQADRDGGALYLRNGSMMPVAHASLVTSSAGDVKSPTPGQGAWSDGALALSDSYVADHAGAVALHGVQAADLVVTTSAFERNQGGDADPPAVEAVEDDPRVPPPQLNCEPLELLPPGNSPLIGAGTDGSDIGAFGGLEAWVDYDGDGVLTLYDCDDTREDVGPGEVELPSDDVDSDCDGLELCWADPDGDGLGDPVDVVESADTHCLGPGEADNADDRCPGWPDGDDRDADGTPDGCDPCPDDAGDDSDGDGVCDGVDRCPGHDDAVDTDADGVPNGCDECSPDEADGDGDGAPDDCDICPGHDDGVDRDGDGTPDGCDPCPTNRDPSCVTGPRDPSPGGEGGAIAVAGCGCAGGPGGGPAWLGVAIALAVGRRPPRHRSPK